MDLPMSLPQKLTVEGKLPIKNGIVKVAIGEPNGLTSNSWRFWSEPSGDFYVKCRDNMKEVKVSLHQSGIWRIALTKEAIQRNPEFVGVNGDRVWERWTKPEEVVSGVAPAFHLVFLTSELAIAPEVRKGKIWRDTHFIEPAPSNLVVMLSLFITAIDTPLMHESMPSFCLGQWSLPNDSYIQLVAHVDPIDGWESEVRRAREIYRQQMENKNRKIPQGAYFYFWGEMPTGARFLLGAKHHGS
jgi:hypothetical protein